MSQQQGRKIAMVGATGTVGTPTLSALLAQNIHTITAITRSSSSSSFPSTVTVKKGEYTDETFLASALSGHDVLIIQLSYAPEAMASQIPIITAAAKAGVKWILPTQWGSNIYGPMAQKFPHMSAKTQYRDLIEQLNLQWIAVVNNPWFDWSLDRGLWFIDMPARKATLFDGDVKFNTTTLAQVGRGVAGLLSLPDEKLDAYKNKPVYFSSFLVSQREILSAAVRATGTAEKDWEIKTQKVEQAVQEAMDDVARGDWMAMIRAYYASHMIEGGGGNYDDQAKKDAEVLGLKEENLDEAVKVVVERQAKK